METMANEQIQLFDDETKQNVRVRFQLKGKNEEQTRLMSIDECVDFLEFMDVLAYNWQWRMIEKMD